MKKRIFFLLSVLLTITMIASPVSAGRGIGLSSVSFSLGSLITTGYAVRLGNTDIKVILAASGKPEVICTNQGSSPAPGQNPPRLGATGAQNLQGLTKNGKAAFDVEAVPPDTLPGLQGGCPNNNWTAHIVFVYWDQATITVTNLAGDVLLVQNYTCKTTRNPDAVSCTAQ
jgi:hypothetical protein